MINVLIFGLSSLPGKRGKCVIVFYHANKTRLHDCYTLLVFVLHVHGFKLDSSKPQKD